MTAVYIICFLLMAAGTIILLGLNPEQVNRDVSEFFDKKQSLKDRSLKAQGRKRKNRLLSELEKTKRALEETGKGRQFSIACAAALLLIIAGCVLSLAIDNPFLIPVLSIAFAVIPFSYIRRTLSLYEARMKEELEIALSIITTSYVRSDNLVTAVNENIQYIKPPVRGIFEAFAAEMTVISPDIRKAIQHLKEKVQNSIYEEWCDVLISCQSDRTLKDTLMPVVSKFTDVRLVNNSLKTMLSETRREYMIMVCMVLANIPLLYCLNKNWYDALMHTILGKIVLAICGIVIIVTAMRMTKLTRPVEYKR
mgnify:FL=1|jgi:hypothetical protein